MSSILANGMAGYDLHNWRGAGDAIPAELWAEAEREASALLAGVIYHDKARRVIAVLQPLELEARNELERLTAERETLHTAWEDGNEEIKRLRHASHRAEVRDERNALAAEAVTLAAELRQKASRLVELDAQIEAVTRQAGNITRALEALRAVELPSVPGGLREWLGLELEPKPEPEPKRRGLRRK